MLACYPGEREILSYGGVAIGVARHGPGGVARHPKGILVLDGLIYDLDDQRLVLGIRDGDDAQVLAELIARYGVAAALARVNGDFALAWTELGSGDIWLARDRFGMRPLFYAKLHDGWGASSQPKGLLQLEDVSATPDRGFLARFGAMHYRMIDSEPTLSPFRDISQVPAATVVRLAQSGEISSYRYWSMEEQPDFDRPESALAEEYRELLIDAVRVRLKRFPNRAFTLSGGMDSSSVLACAVQVEGQRQIAYSSLYEDRTYDERDEIADMLPNNVSDWRKVILPNAIDLVGDVDRMITKHDEPVATSTWLSHMRLCDQAAKDGITAMFGGLGGDELNAGEYEYFPLHFADLKQSGQSILLTQEISAWVRHHDHPIFKKTPKIATDLIGRLTDPTQPGLCLPDLSRLRRYLTVLSPEFADFQNYMPLMDRLFSTCLKNRTWQDLTQETLPCCIRAEDRHGAVVGMPPVLPFLDHRVVRFMYRVPGEMKIRDGITKRLLREATFGVLPEATRTRLKKTGWNAPAHIWFSGKGADILRDLTHSNTFDNLGLYDKKKVLTLINDHERIVTTGVVEDNHMMFLWAFLNMMRWQAWLDTKGYRNPIKV